MWELANELMLRGDIGRASSYDTQVLAHSDWVIELGPGAGAKGGNIIAQGTVRQLEADPASRIGPFLKSHLEPRPGGRISSTSAASG